MNKTALFAVLMSAFMLSSFHRPHSYATVQLSSNSPMRSISSTTDFNEGAALRAHFDAKRAAVQPEVDQPEY